MANCDCTITMNCYYGGEARAAHEQAKYILDQSLDNQRRRERARADMHDLAMLQERLDREACELSLRLGEARTKYLKAVGLG